MALIHPVLHAALARSRRFQAEYLGSVVSTADQTTYDFGNFLARRDGLMVVGIAAEGGAARNISSVSIGGTNGTINGQFAGSVWTPTGFASRAVLPGHNNISVTFDAGMVRAAAAVWLLTNYTSATHHAIDGLDGGGTGTSISVTINIPANGAALYVHSHANNNATTWSSAIPRHDSTFETNQFSAADKSVTEAITGHIETASYTGAVGRRICGASWS